MKSPTVTITCLPEAVEGWAESINHPCQGNCCRGSTINDSPPCEGAAALLARQERIARFYES